LTNSSGITAFFPRLRPSETAHTKNRPLSAPSALYQLLPVLLPVVESLTVTSVTCTKVTARIVFCQINNTEPHLSVKEGNHIHRVKNEVALTTKHTRRFPWHILTRSSRTAKTYPPTSIRSIVKSHGGDAMSSGSMLATALGNASFCASANKASLREIEQSLESTTRGFTILGLTKIRAFNVG